MISDQLRKKFLIALENCMANGYGASNRLDTLLAVAAELQAERKAEASRLAARQHLVEMLYFQAPLR